MYGRSSKLDPPTKAQKTNEHTAITPKADIVQKMAQAAAQGLELKKKKYGGARDLGMRRGHQLANKRPLSIHDLQVMRAWFARHVHTSYPSYERWLSATREEKAQKDKWHGAVAWLLWGGTAAYYYVMSNHVQEKIVENGRREGRRLKPHVQSVKGLLS